jgi:hypothetical protein
LARPGHSVVVGAQVDEPVIAAHDVARRILEVEDAEEAEAGLAADRVRRRVVDGREGVQVPAPARGLRLLDQLERGSPVAPSTILNCREPGFA